MTIRPAAALVALSLLACSGAADLAAAPTIVTEVGAPKVAAPAWTGAALPRATVRRMADDLPAVGVDMLVRAGDLVAGGTEGAVIVWDRDGHELLRAPVPGWAALTVCEAGLVAVATEGGSVVVIDARSGAERARLQVASTDVGLSADGAWLAIATDDDIRIVEVATGETARTIVPEYGADAVAFAPDGQTLWSSDAFAHHAWAVATGAEIARFGGGFASEFKLREGALWVFLDGVDPPQRYDAATYARIEDLKLGELVYTGDIDAKRLVLDGYATDPATMRRVRLTASEVEDVALPREDEVWFATGSALERWRDLPEARLVDGPVRVPRPEEAPGNVISGVAWPAEGLSVAIAGPRVRRYGGAAPVDVDVPCAHDDEPCDIESLQVTDGALEVAFYDDSIWRVEGEKASKTRRTVRRDEEPAPLVGAGGVRLVTEYDAVIAYDAAGGELFRLGAPSRVADVALSPDGRWAAVADTALHLVDLEAGREVAQVVFSEDYGVDHVAFSPDGKEIAAVQTWESGDHVWVVPLAALSR